MFLITSRELHLSNQLAALWKFSLASDRDFMHFFSNPHTRWALSILSPQMLRSQPLEDQGFYSLFATVLKRPKSECWGIWVSRNFFSCSKTCQRFCVGECQLNDLGVPFQYWNILFPHRQGWGEGQITKMPTKNARQMGIGATPEATFWWLLLEELPLTAISWVTLPSQFH